MAKLTQVFSNVGLKINPANLKATDQLTSILHGKTVRLEQKDDHFVATGPFQDIRATYKNCMMLQTTSNGAKDPRQKERSLQSPQSDFLVVEPVMTDDIIMHYIETKKYKELQAIRNRNSVSINMSKNHVTFMSQTGKRIHAQFAREEFVTLYQKIATGLQMRTYTYDPKMIAICGAEFPELLIITSADGKQMNLIGSFISLDQCETFLNGSAGRYSPHQTQSKTKHRDTPHTPVKQEKTAEKAKDETCPICLEPIKTLESTVLPKCQHRFCKDCLKRAFQMKPACPMCGEIYGDLTGTQPKGGTMTVSKDRSSLPGFEKYGTIVINYYIPSGRQGDEHPNPGMMYSGVSRIAYLPDSTEGNHVLKLLQRAFNQRLTFTIGQSSTTGRNNVVTWNDIHHKTSRTGGLTCYGYPDPDYMKRVQDELKAKGIK